MDYSSIEYEVIGPVVRLWQNRPQASNAQTGQMLAELEDALQRAERDMSVRVVIVAGRGKHFSAGHDVKDALEKRTGQTPEQRYQWESRFYYDVAMKLWDHRCPTVAQVQGACIAGGLMTANMCDMLVASESAFFSEPVIHSMGITAVELLMHPWVMNARKAKEFLLTGMRLSAQEALQLGMVNRVVADDQLDEHTLAMAQQIAKAPPFAAQMLKRSINRTLEIQGMRGSLQAHFDTHQLTHLTQEGHDLRAGYGAAGMLKKGKEPSSSS